MPRLRMFALLVLVCGSSLSQLRSATPEVQELIERERVRATIEKAYDSLAENHPTREAWADAVEEAVQHVIEIGPPAVEFMVPELSGLDARRVLFTIYALGRLGANEAEQPLRALVESCNRQGAERNDRFNTLRKGWACLSLGMLGHADAIDLLESGVVWSGVSEWYRGMSFLDATAIVTAPESLPRLQALVQRYDGDEKLDDRQPVVLAALGRVADSSTRPFLLGLVDHPRVDVRAQAIETLGRLGPNDDARRAILVALSDPVDRIRKAAASGLDAMGLPSIPEAALSRLTDEPLPSIRGVLYRVLAETRGEAALPTLLRHWGRPDGLDRMRLIEAIGVGRLANGINLLREGLRDPDARVGLRAVAALVEIGTPASVEALLEAVQFPGWQVRLAALDALTGAEERRAASRAAELLLGDELPSGDGPVLRRPRVEALCHVIDHFGYTERLDELRSAAESEKDLEVRAVLERLLRHLDEVSARGGERGRWVELAASPERDLRRLAYTRLASLGGTRSSEALAALFGTATDDEDREAILAALAQAADPAASDLVVRVLEDPGFDPVTRRTLRDQAAWAARRIGGDRMIAALRASAVRRQGRDFKVLAYLGALDGPDALDVLTQVRTPRVTYPRWDRGEEQRKLDWMIQRLRQGRSVWQVDVPPSQLEFEF